MKIIIHITTILMVLGMIECFHNASGLGDNLIAESYKHEVEYDGEIELEFEVSSLYSSSYHNDNFKNMIYDLSSMPLEIYTDKVTPPPEAL